MSDIIDCTVHGQLCHSKSLAVLIINSQTVMLDKLLPTNKQMSYGWQDLWLMPLSLKALHSPTILHGMLPMLRGMLPDLVQKGVCTHPALPFLTTQAACLDKAGFTLV